MKSIHNELILETHTGTFHQTFDEVVRFGTSEKKNWARIVDIRWQLDDVFDANDFDLRRDEYWMKLLGCDIRKDMIEFQYHLKLYKKEEENAD